MAEQDDRITVDVAITETTRYATQVTMRRSTFERLDNDLESGGHFNRKATIEIGGYIDPQNDWVDATTESVDEFTIIEKAKL